ncbi:hypothetical protein BQ8482_330194 [Mesorhizobium delmotii]|uniref:Uncharacterized protein n=1 Tax=Mesorhizobium delmotii TaxID=1631247 RepID=A0A2P9APK2_9HYPH|nr:hypothetical protein BQ8482_330194 [Mesorhizobium delmotii]
MIDPLLHQSKLQLHPGSLQRSPILQPKEVAVCDLGLTLGIAAGIANAAGQASAAGAFQ